MIVEPTKSSSAFILGVAGIEIIYTLFAKMLGNAEAGWSSLMISIWLLGGINLTAISVVGVYIGKIFTEVKHRPLFHIEDKTGIYINSKQVG